MTMNNKIETRTVREQIYDEVREMIVDGTWEPGARVDLNKIVQDFGISKTPLNEAIQKLIQEGLLFVKSRSGTFVSNLKIEEINMAFEFRLALEIGAAATIILKTDNSLVDRLRKITTKMEAVLEAQKPGFRTLFLKLDAEFHDEVISVSENKLIIDHYRQVNSLSNVSRTRRKFTLEEYSAALNDHELIMDALTGRDVGGFQAACQDHVHNAKNKLHNAIDVKEI